MPTLRERAELRLGRAEYLAAQRFIRRVTGLQRLWIEVDGLQIPYLRGGRGPTLLLLHGFGDRKETFGPLAIGLYRHFDLVIPDLPGFGDAPVVPNERVSAKAQSGFVARFLAAVGVPRCHVLGQSMGGAVAVRFADDHPQLTSSLTLLSAAGPDGLAPAFQAAIDRGKNPLLARDLGEFEQLLALAFEKPLLYPRAVRRHLARQWSRRSAEHAAHFQRMVDPPADEELAREYPAIGCPTLLVYGTEERVVNPANAGTYHRGIRTARLVMLRDVGHNPHHEATRKVASLVRSMLDGS